MGGRRWLGGLLGGVVEGLGSSVEIRINDCLRALGIVYVCLIFGLLWACLIRLFRIIEPLQWLM